MKIKSITIIITLLLSVIMIFHADVNVSAQDYDALKDVKSIKAVFDFRIGKPESAVMLLDLIRDTYKEENIRNVTDKPEFVVVFLGPAVKLISTQTEGFSDEEKELVGNVANTIKEMANEGIGLEICVFAAHVLGVDPATVLPEIKQVGNGWISLIGYQAKGYSLVPVY